MLNGLRRELREPIPFRFLVMRWLSRRFGLFSYQTSLELGAVDRPWYGYCLLHSAWIARKLGYTRITAIEFGVAGGNGLVALERHAKSVEKETGVEIAIYGFDSGAGMPSPRDVRDMPYLWQKGYFTMDHAKLQARLQSAKLEIGSVEETIMTFLDKTNPPPIGFISFDLDYYFSTVSALRIFDGQDKYFLPRVTCYFDDLAGGIMEAYNEFTGEIRAIEDFNTTHPDVKIARVRGLQFHTNNIPFQWHEQIYVAHRFIHPAYGKPIATASELPLNEDRGD